MRTNTDLLETVLNLREEEEITSDQAYQAMERIKSEYPPDESFSEEEAKDEILSMFESDSLSSIIEEALEDKEDLREEAESGDKEAFNELLAYLSEETDGSFGVLRIKEELEKELGT